MAVINIRYDDKYSEGKMIIYNKVELNVREGKRTKNKLIMMKSDKCRTLSCSDDVFIIISIYFYNDFDYYYF